MSFLEKIFGDWNTKEINRIERTASRIESLDEAMQALSSEELRAKTDEFRLRLSQGESLDDILPETFAVAREAASRTLGMKHFHVQLIGGIVLHEGNIAEMKTGEGKTLVATLPVYLNALAGKGVHVVTVNDYLAQRDMEWMGKLYSFLGLSMGCVVHGISSGARKQAYMADVTYGTNNEFGFDYLRDNMVLYAEDQMQRELNFAIVDEVDSILVDEARTPLIISGQGVKSTELYSKADRFVRTLREGKDFEKDEKEKTVSLTEEGVAGCERYFGIDNFSDPENMEVNHHVHIALKAHNIMKRDVDYIDKDGEIVIVDEFTGRLMFGRRYSDGLHQAIEAKEGIEVRRESRTLATITLQNYFRMYAKLAGMTGTAKTEEAEFTDIYNMQVVEIPTNRPVIRDDLDDSIYSTQRGKYLAIVDEIAGRHETGQPVLVGTISIEKSEIISELLKRRGVSHSVLNAKQHAREAEIVAEAGRLGSVTIATNMAGRGTDIILGGNPDFEAKKEMKRLEYTDEEISFASSFVLSDDKRLLESRAKYEELLKRFTEERKGEQEQVRSLGGLHIIGTERHEARRIDNQLRGRSGRQGDPGSSQFFIAMDDELMRLFGGDRMQSIVEKLGVDEGEPIEAGMLTKSIENAQKRVEGRNYSIRKYVLQYDDVMNRQRSIIYSERNRVLTGEDLRESLFNMLEELIEEIVEPFTIASHHPEEWDFAELNKRLKGITPQIPDFSYDGAKDPNMDKTSLKAQILTEFERIYEEKEGQIGAETMREVERMILLRVVDTKWMDHIDAMDQLKTGIGLRSLGQQDPAQAYANEGFDMFELMIKSISEDMVRFCFNVTINTSAERKSVVIGETDRKDEAESVLAGSASAPEVDTQSSKIAVNRGGDAKPEPVRREGKKIGRNSPCPCGSGKKYKNCCGKN